MVKVTTTIIALIDFAIIIIVSGLSAAYPTKDATSAAAESITGR